MRWTGWTCAAASILTTALLNTSWAADVPTGALAIGSLSLPDHHGRPRALQELHDRDLLVVAIVGTECPLARLYGRRLAELANRFPERVRWLAVDSNVQDTLTEVSAYARRSGIEFPILLDSSQQLADLLGATRTPEVFVLDREYKVQYHGRIDDQYGVGVARPAPQQQYLSAALEALLAGRAAPVPSTEAVGCLIGRRPASTGKLDLTYARDIAPILNRRCVECHRAGQIAPFSLASFAELAGWEPMIAEVVQAGRMPPWNANPQHGQFRNDSRLSDSERETLLRWIANGAPEGDPADLPPAPQFADGWRIEQPEHVIYMRDEPFQVPATGTVDYQYFVVDPQFEDDLYISAVEARPGNPEVVHHIIVYVLDPEEKNGANLRHLLVGYAPGTPPFVAPEGSAIVVPKGRKLLFELHYTPNGVAQTDRSYVGFKLRPREGLKAIVGGGQALRHDFRIPPQADNYEVTAQSRLNSDVRLISFSPHMHLRGKSFRYEARLPDGRREVLLDVPQYDFNWQLRYVLAEPLPLPKGTEIHCIAHFDNSPGNLNNPDPTREVRWGEQSWDEMMIGFYSYLSDLPHGGGPSTGATQD